MLNAGEVYKMIRKLAKTQYYQNMYSQIKELNLELFENKREFSQMQLHFLNLLNFYSIINMDISLGEVDERVLNNEVYEDAYMLVRKKLRKKEMDKFGKDNVKRTENQYKRTSGRRAQTPKQSSFSWVFKSPKKRSL